MDWLPELLASLWRLTQEAAPWLLFGLLLSGVIKVWLSEGLVSRVLGGRGPWPVIKAAFIGAPLPLCSCGVVPAALGLHRAGASRGATVSFLIATPETGADSLAISYALLGPFMTILRPLAALISAILTGLLAAQRAFDPPPPAPTLSVGRFALKLSATPSAPSCDDSDCGCHASTPATPAMGLAEKLRQSIRYAFGDILDDIAPWLLLGLLLAALLDTLIDPGQLATFGSGLPAMLLMLLVGIPLYICATASTPLAASLLLAGVSPGTVLVFLLAGPATNLATLGIIRRELGGRLLLAYLLGISLCSLGLGLLTDGFVNHFAIDIPAQLGVAAELLPSWLASGSALLLIGVAAARRLRRSLG